MKRMMKYVMAATVTAMALAFQSCGDKDSPLLPDEPEEDVIVFNRNDSAVFCDVFKKAYKGYEGLMCEKYHVQLDDIWTWSDLCQWVWDDTTKEARIFSLSIFAIDTDEYPGYVSSRILELDSLRQLKIRGKGIHGTLPVHPDGKGRLAQLGIWQTSMTWIPDDVFKYPNLYDFYLEQNYNMIFPKGILKMGKQKIFPNGDPTRFWFDDNGFTGECPMDISQFVLLTDNKFTSVDWTGMEDKDYKEVFKVTGRHPGPHLSKNPIKTRVPDYILSDTLAIVYVNNCLGYGDNRQIENFPSGEEVYKMKEEWKKNHPEEAKELIFL